MSNEIEMYDSLSPQEAVRRAWLLTGVNFAYHQEQQRELAKKWPLLARAIDRLARTAAIDACGLGVSAEYEEDRVDGRIYRYCTACGTQREFCMVCKENRFEGHELPVGFGSYDTRRPLRLCEQCLGKIKHAVSVAAGREQESPYDSNGAWRRDR